MRGLSRFPSSFMSRMKRGIPGREADADAQELREAARVSTHPGSRRRARSASSRGAVDGRPPELLLAAEVVLDEAEVHVGARGDVARGGAVEAALGEDLERRREDALAGLRAPAAGATRTAAPARRPGRVGVHVPWAMIYTLD